MVFTFRHILKHNQLQVFPCFLIICGEWENVSTNSEWRHEHDTNDDMQIGRVVCGAGASAGSSSRGAGGRAIVRARRSQPRRPIDARDKPFSYTKPNKPFPWNSHKGTASVKKKRPKTYKKAVTKAGELEIRMAPVLGRLGAGVVFTSFIMIVFLWSDP